jgi:hypothetical protein
LTSRLQSFETELLTQAEPGRPGRAQSGAGRQGGNYRFTAAGGARHGQHRIPVYGRQEQGTYNGHFESTCYHPLLLFNGEGDCLAVKLRPGNVHSAEGWEELLVVRDRPAASAGQGGGLSR